MDEDKPRKMCGPTGAALDLRIRMTQYVSGKIAWCSQRCCLAVVLSVYEQRLGAIIVMRMALHAEPQNREECVHLLLC